ncbi:hypothetical protein [Pelagibacterium sediminicola]|uniref:hypothetical protein n=1 Tax=Pelagibacterium sediminicola TaxID=2248761 RepID=UPI000E30FD17|nr:hypothetical protein [Pelagibacterium sediminicola]
MSRYVLIIAAAALASGAGAVHAADWGVSSYEEPAFKPAYPVDYTYDDPLTFEAGLRYFYSWGGQSFQTGGNTYSANDTAHSFEGHLRIDDRSTSTYLKGHIGFGAIADGEYSTNGVQTSAYQIGRISYGVADFGYTPLDTGSMRLGVFGGYQFTHEAPSNIGLDIHSLRLGVSGRVEVADVFDINAEVAAIPYSVVSGSMRNTDGPTTISNLDGSLYGGSAEVMVGFHPTDMFTIRGGVRGTYLNGHVMSDPGSAQRYVETFRWGPVVELTASF